MPVDQVSDNPAWRSIDELADALRRDVATLATDIGERNVWCADKLNDAADFIDGSFREMGYEVNRQPFEAEGVEVYNIEASMPAPDDAPVLIVGAHYDSRCAMDRIRRGRKRLSGQPGTPGANDNGTGVAATLALARAFARSSQPVALRFVAFVNEEPPFFRTNLMGSLVYARRCRERGENVVGMLTPETLGYYSDEPGSQRYPFPLGLTRSSVGNFIAFLSNLRSKPLLRRTLASFQSHSSFPAIAQAFPAVTRGVAWSDDWAFWQCGYPALAITDTAFMRYDHYHTLEDTPDKLKFDRMAQVVAGLVGVVGDLMVDAAE